MQPFADCFQCCKAEQTTNIQGDTSMLTSKQNAYRGMPQASDNHSVMPTTNPEQTAITL